MQEVESLKVTMLSARGTYRMDALKEASLTKPLSIYAVYLEFARDYIWAHGYSKSTAENYKLAVLSFTRAVDDKAIDEITLEDIYKWRESMEHAEMARNSINKYLYSLRTILNFASKKYALVIDPSQIIIPKYVQQLPKFLTKTEIDRLIAVGDLRERAIVSLMYSSGMRVGEIVSLRKKDILGDSIKVRGKGDKERISFIDERAKTYLQEYLLTRTDSSPFVFYSRKGGGLGKVALEHIIRDLAMKAHINKIVTPHVIRHSFATHMAQAGIGTFHLQKLLGHSHISTTQIYVHLTGSDVREAYKKFH